MATPTRIERIRALPPAVFDELYSDDDYEQTHAVAERYDLNKEQEEVFSNTLSDVFLKDVPVEKLPVTIAERLKVPEDVAKKIAVTVAGTRLLRLLDYFGDVPARILDWGGDPKNFLSVRNFDDRAALVLADEIVKKLSLNLPADAVQKLAAMVGSRVRGIRDDSEFKAALSRPLEKGGVAANAETAEKILAEVELFLKKEKEKPTASRGEGAEALAGPPLPQPPAEATTPEALRHWVITASGLQFDAVTAKRFGELAESRLDGSRDTAAFKEVLMRGTKVGGLGLDTLAADKVVQLADAAYEVRVRDRVRETPPEVSYSSSEAQRSREVSESESQREVLAPKAPSPTPQLLAASHEAMVGAAKPAIEVRSQKSGSRLVAPAPRSNNSSTRLTTDILRAERSEVEKSESQRKVTAPKIVEDADDVEIATAAQALPQKVPMDAAAMSIKLQDATAAVIRLFGFQFSNPDIQKRFENTVSARLRDLRDAVETAEMLARPVSEGGVGLTPEQLKAVAPILEEHVRAFQAELQIEKKRELAEWKKDEGAKSREKKTAKDLAEEVSRDALLARITGKSKKAQKAMSQPATKARKSTGQKVSYSSSGAQRSREVGKLESQREVLAPQPAMRPKMQDVRFTPKLVGPVEELRGITLTDFRRLSKDPKEAAVKIRDKVDLLGQESYTRRITAVTAWQESEVYQLYLEVLRESLGGGKPVKEIIAGKTTTGKVTLTEPEFTAIMELSKALRL